MGEWADLEIDRLLDEAMGEGIYRHRRRRRSFARGRELAHRAKEIRDSFDTIKEEEITE